MCLWACCLLAFLVPCFTSAQSTSTTASGSSTGSASSTLVVAPISLSTAFLRILGSLGLGGLIGLEREITNITRRLRGMAGIRTHAVICTGSCLIQLVSVYAYADISGYSTSRDPSRLAAQAVSGIGFVGAGAILKGGENVIYGLTSAASIWLVMAVGLAVGLGYWPVASLTVVLVVAAMVVTKRGEHVVFGRRYGPGYTAEMEVVCDSGPDTLQHIVDCVSKQLSITNISIDRRDSTPPRKQQQQHSNQRNQPAPSSLPTATTASPSSAELPSLSSLPSSHPLHSSTLCAKFVVEADNCSRQSFLLHLQLTVQLLMEDVDVHSVDSRNVQEVREGPTHRMEWNVQSEREREHMEREMDTLKQEVRQRRMGRRREKVAARGGGAAVDVDVEGEGAVRVDVEQTAKRGLTAASRTSSGGGGDE